MALMRSFLLVLCTGTLCVFTGADDPDVSVLEGDDACTDSEEGECSLSLRQLRLGRQQAQTEEAAGEGDGEPVSFALPCTEPSEFAAEYDSGSLENFSFAEINQHVQESETADETGSDCFEHDVYYREANHAISMHGAHRTVQHSADACQSACANHKGCAHFSYWKDGGCLLTSSGAHSVKHHGVVSGAGSCSGGASYEGAPTGAYTGPSVMTVKNRGGMPPPKGVQQYNGIAWPTMKIGEKKAVYHMFAIGDWGALIGTNPGRMIQYRSGQTGGPHTMARWRGPCTTDQMASCMGGGQCPSDCHFEHDADYRAQVNVANTMRKFAADRNPDLFINVGDNFYWGGINTYCGTPMHKIDPVTAHQFREIFENVYHGPGVDGKPWLSVLGNHDYGGFQFNKAWDQQITYTWASDRWVMPGQYFMQRVEYPEFSVEIFMLDSNAMDSHPKSADPKHNICGAMHNPPGANCAATGGPKDLDACFKFMWDTWRSQEKWTEKKLEDSTADWQLIATHFQCGHQANWYKKLHQNLGLDLLVTGHTHVQNIFDKWHVLGGLTCFITGGGGGITAEVSPKHSHTTAYGFFDLAFTKDEIKLESINFRGNKIGSATVTPVAKNL